MFCFRGVRSETLGEEEKKLKNLTIKSTEERIRKERMHSFGNRQKVLKNVSCGERTETHASKSQQR